MFWIANYNCDVIQTRRTSHHPVSSFTNTTDVHIQPDGSKFRLFLVRYWLFRSNFVKYVKHTKHRVKACMSEHTYRHINHPWTLNGCQWCFFEQETTGIVYHCGSEWLIRSRLFLLEPARGRDVSSSHTERRTCHGTTCPSWVLHRAGSQLRIQRDTLWCSTQIQKTGNRALLETNVPFRSGLFIPPLILIISR